MSRTSTGKPEFRLRFDYPHLEFERIGAPPRRIPLDTGDPSSALRGLAAEVARAGGRLTAVLPEAEVWRGRVAASDRRGVARGAAAAALGGAPDRLALAFGPVAADGLCAAAAVRRATIAEARAFLAKGGLRPARITAAGAFPGFDGPPAFGGFGLPPALDAPRVRAAGGLAAMLALALWLAPWRVEMAPPGTPEPVAELSPSPASPPALAPPASVGALVPPAPLARPADFPRPPALTRSAVAPELVPVALAARNTPSDAETPSAALAVPASQAVAALPLAGPPRARPVRVAPPVAVPQAGATPAEAAAMAGGPAAGALRPLPRPAAARGATLNAAPMSASARAEAPASDAPRPRPAAPSLTPAILVASLGPTAVTATDATPETPRAPGPLARPHAAKSAPVVLAALAPAAATAGLGDVPAVAPPLARRIAPALAPEAVPPAKAIAAVPARAQPAPQPARVRTVRLDPPAQPVRRIAPARTLAPVSQPARVVQKAQPARIQPARIRPVPVVREARLQPARQQPARVQPARQARVQPAPAQPSRAGRGLRGGSLELIGIFGAASGRHALVQLPSGDTERVRAGDQLQGVQVTAIAADGVHLRAQGRDTVLRLPD